MNFKEALKAAIDGAKIRLPIWKKESFATWSSEKSIFMDENFFSTSFDVSESNSTDWEIVPNLVKYSVNVWLNKKPKNCLFSNEFIKFLVGYETEWSSTSFEQAKKYRITVEEVGENG